MSWTGVGPIRQSETSCHGELCTVSHCSCVCKGRKHKSVLHIHTVPLSLVCSHGSNEITTRGSCTPFNALPYRCNISTGQAHAPSDRQWVGQEQVWPHSRPPLKPSIQCRPTDALVTEVSCLRHVVLQTSLCSQVNGHCPCKSSSSRKEDPLYTAALGFLILVAHCIHVLSVQERWSLTLSSKGLQHVNQVDQLD